MSDRRPSSLKRRLALTPATAGCDFLPLAAARPFLAQNKKVAPWLPFTACRPLRGAGRPPPVCRQPSRPRWARPEKLKGHDNGDHRHLHLERQRLLRLDPHPRSQRQGQARPRREPSDKGPHFRIFAGNVELGAAWQKTARDTERDYLSVKLDDPSFPAPIYATLIEVEGQEGLQLIWSRPSRD
jgi:uncharacterized protein (DUF736 family)